MSDLTRHGAHAHIEDLRRDANRSAMRREALTARRRSQLPHDGPITIRQATEDDKPALAQLASLDCARLPAGAVLLAESRGELRAALSLADPGSVRADARPLPS